MKRKSLFCKQSIFLIVAFFFLYCFCAGCSSSEDAQSYLAASNTGTPSGENSSVVVSEEDKDETTNEFDNSPSVNGNNGSSPQQSNDAPGNTMANDVPADSVTDRNGAETVPPEKEIGNFPAFVVSDAKGKPGQTVEITVCVDNNPGIISAALDVTYDREKLRLTEVKDAELLANPTFSQSTEKYPYYISWNDALASKNNTGNGTLVTLTFEIVKGTSGKAEVELSFDPDNVFDYDLNNVAFKAYSGFVYIQ